MTDTRVRFAPSPTGPLHLGSARTALLNWLFARSSGGKFLLRIDDTDRERSDSKWESQILAGLDELGLDWDEGPVRQSQRGDRYGAALERLPTVEDDGALKFDGRVVARSDGSVLYHLATAVDDMEDGITHVLRGRDHLSNTQLQESLIRALGGTPPRYVHAPLLIGKDGQKLSKRGGDPLLVSDLTGAGYMPVAIANVLALSLADFRKLEVMTLAQLSENFELARLHSADSRFDEDKLRWLNGQHIRLLAPTEFRTLLSSWLDPAELAAAGDELISLAYEAAQSDSATLGECASTVTSLLAPSSIDVEAELALAADRVPEAISLFCSLAWKAGSGLEDARRLVANYRAALKANDLPLPVGMKALRAAATGRAHGPELPYVIACLSSERLDKLCERAG